MNEMLIGIQRDVVIQYLRTEFPLLKVSCEGSYEASFELEKGQYSVQQSVIIFPKKLAPQWMQIDKNAIRVSFYFRKRGLQFDSIMQTSDVNAAIGIPNSIEKTADTISFDTPTYRGKLYYNVGKAQQSFVPCVSSTLFPLFNPSVWKIIEPDDEIAFFSILSRYSNLHQAADLPKEIENLLLKTKKILFFPEKRFPKNPPFPFDACFTVRDLENRSSICDELAQVRSDLHLLADLCYIPIPGITGGRAVSIERTCFENKKMNACAKITEEQIAYLPAAAYLSNLNVDSQSSVQGRIEPIEILYLSDEFVCFGCSLNTISMTEREEYVFKLSIGFRKIVAKCVVLSVMVEDEKVSVVCRFTGMTPEDRRFLYEKHFGAMLSGKI